MFFREVFRIGLLFDQILPELFQNLYKLSIIPTKKESEFRYAPMAIEKKQLKWPVEWPLETLFETREHEELKLL